MVKQNHEIKCVKQWLPYIRLNELGRGSLTNEAVEGWALGVVECWAQPMNQTWSPGLKSVVATFKLYKCSIGVYNAILFSKFVSWRSKRGDHIPKGERKEPRLRFLSPMLFKFGLHTLLIRSHELFMQFKNSFLSSSVDIFQAIFVLCFNIFFLFLYYLLIFLVCWLSSLVVKMDGEFWGCEQEKGVKAPKDNVLSFSGPIHESVPFCSERVSW